MNIISVIIVVVCLIAGIIYHEFGHMKAARHRNIRVKTFCIGLGKPFISRKGADGTEYGIAPVPLGGYCSMDDEELNSASLSSYVIVLLAGVLRNFILGTLLIIAGQLIIKGGFVSLPLLCKNVMVCVNAVVGSLGESIGNMFNLKTMAANGGMVTQMAATGTTIAASAKTFAHVVGLSLMSGGIMNYMLVVFNMLPVPGLDGGQVVVRFICEISKRAFHRTINQNIVASINMIVIMALIWYQGVILLFDIPWVRNLFL